MNETSVMVLVTTWGIGIVFGSRERKNKGSKTVFNINDPYVRCNGQDVHGVALLSNNT